LPTAPGPPTVHNMYNPRL